jgi:hypothetical protein
MTVIALMIQEMLKVHTGEYDIVIQEGKAMIIRRTFG